MSSIPAYFKIAFEPAALPEMTVRMGFARFTVLTPRLIRMEYSPENRMEDRPSQAIWFRKQPPVPYTSQLIDGSVTLNTGFLSLVYKGGPFSAESLSVQVAETGATWHYGDVDQENLGGTGRTLDVARGAIQIEQGLISRSGWSVVDDSQSLVFNQESWLEDRSAVEGTLDLYFFGFGHDYLACLKDFSKVAGPVSMVPRWVLGNWWSRYWEYTQAELSELMLDFQRREVPLSVCIIDMDWHITQTGNGSSGWTGYTWNRKLFPDPQGQLRFLHELGLRAGLNLHPAEGVWPHEEAYPTLAAEMGVDPASGKPVEFDIANPNYAKLYFDVLHHPMEAQGVDFWWMDWQQGTRTKVKNLDPLWWLNHLHFYDLARDGKKRSFIFSRWGGLGNHRYPIGFSGDTVVCWESLAFQPYFTATAANVNYGWWSHDIGGHMGGTEDGEQYTRWVQFGAFSPILRLHSTKNELEDRRPWGYDESVFAAAKDALQLRHALIPYLYSMSWRFHQESIPPVLPMYYLQPEQEAAYHCPNQYAFGSELVIAPFTSPRDESTRLSRQVVWLPESESSEGESPSAGWYDFWNGSYYPGGWYPLYGGLKDTPVFAKAGAIVPMGPKVGWGGVDNPTQLSVFVFPGASNQFSLYEDDGKSNDYLNGARCETRFVQQWHKNKLVFSMEPAEGREDLLPKKRDVTLIFRGVNPPEQMVVMVNGKSVMVDSCYDPLTFTLAMSAVQVTPQDRIEVALMAENGLENHHDYRPAVFQKIVRAFRMETISKSFLLECMDAILKEPQQLSIARINLSEAQLRALSEVILEAGIHRTDAHGKDLIVVWNQHESGQAGLVVNANHHGHAWDSKRTYMEYGPAPRFRALQPGIDFEEKKWLVQFTAGPLLNITFSEGE